MIPTTVQRIPAGARNHPARLKSATASHTLARRSIHAADEPHADHAPPLLSDNAASPRDGRAHRADDATNDYGPRSLRAATPATEIHRAGRETFRAPFADHPASLLIDAEASRSDPFAARSRPASIASERRTPTRPRRVTPLARAHRKTPPCALATVAPRLPPTPVGECIASAPPAHPGEWGSATRSAPFRPRRVTPLARSYRDEAAVLRRQRSRRGSRPRSWPVQRGCHTRPPFASRPLHARTAMKPPCSRQRSRRFPPR